MNNISVNGKQAFVSLTGKIYAHDAGVLRNNLLEQIDRGVSDITIDFREVTYIDSSGLGVLVTIHKRVAEKNGKLSLSNVQGMVHEILRRTRLDKVLTVS